MSRVVTLNVLPSHIKCNFAKEDSWRAKEGVWYSKTRVLVSCLHAFTVYQLPVNKRVVVKHRVKRVKDKQSLSRISE